MHSARAPRKSWKLPTVTNQELNYFQQLPVSEHMAAYLNGWLYWGPKNSSYQNATQNLTVAQKKIYWLDSRCKSWSTYERTKLTKTKLRWLRYCNFQTQTTYTIKKLKNHLSQLYMLYCFMLFFKKITCKQTGAKRSLLSTVVKPGRQRNWHFNPGWNSKDGFGAKF